MRQAELVREGLWTALRAVEQIVGVPGPHPSGDLKNEQQIRAVIAYRRARAKFFPAELFADPAWDILLELYAASLSQYRVTISRLCECAAVPPTTALRWIGNLESSGLVERRADPTDGRRVFVSLSSTGQQSIEAYFRTVAIDSTVI